MGEQVRIPVAGDAAINGYFAAPEGGSRLPGVIVLHEVWGLNDDMRAVSERIAAQGYAVVAPDLYSHGNKAICLTRVLSELRHLGDGQVATDIARTRSWLADRDTVDPARIGIIGFCMGGGFALAAAARGGFSAVSTNYGAVPKKDRLGGICPVVGSYGALDRTFAKQGERLERYLEELGVPHDVKHYDDVGHSFMTAGGGPSLLAKLPNPMHAGYSAAEADDAWDRVFRFFDQYVKEVPTMAEERAETRAAGSLPEEQAAGADIGERQAEVILEESDERTFDRDASPDTHLEKRTSEETVEPD
jgi:carboxymethylenebutenolidase